MNDRSSEQGSALFYIIIAVALLAALSFAVMRGSRSGQSSLTNEQASLAAREITAYGHSIASAVQKLRLRGITDVQISFENSIDAGYTNPNCSIDDCKIFATAGGSAGYMAPQSSYTSGTLVWHFIGDTAISGIGTTCASASCADLVLLLDDLNQTVCEKINELLGISETMPDDSDMGGTSFQGVYSYAATLGDEVNSSSLHGRTSGCFHESDGSPEYMFYQVLLAR